MKAEPQDAALPAARASSVPALTAAATRRRPAVTAGTLTGTLMSQGVTAHCKPTGEEAG